MPVIASVGVCVFILFLGAHATNDMIPAPTPTPDTASSQAIDPAIAHTPAPTATPATSHAPSSPRAPAPSVEPTPSPAPSPTPSSSPPAPQLLRLNEAVHLALKQNERLINAQDSVDQAKLSLRLARSGFRPKITPNISGSFGQSDASNQTYRLDLSQKLTTGTELRATVGTASSRNQIGTYYNTDTTLSLSQPLLRGFGRQVARRSLSTAEIRNSGVLREQHLSEQQVAVEVASSYYRIVAQRQMLDVSRKMLERSRALLEASQAKLEAGKVSQLDVFRAQQLVAQAEGQMLDADAAVDDAFDQLRLLLGENLDFLFDVETDIPSAEERYDLDQSIALALENRLELRAAQDQLREAERNIAFNRNQLLPQVDLNLALTRRDVADSFSSSFKFRKFDFATFFTISMPVDRTPQTIEYNNALIDLARRRRDLENLKLRVTEQVRRAIRQQQRLLRSREVVEASVDFAQKEVEVATLRFQRGLSNNLDMVNAEEALLSARSRRIALLADMVIANLQIRMTLGLLNPRLDFPPPPSPAASTP